MLPGEEVMIMSEKIGDRPFYKRFFTMTITLALQNLIVFGVNLADSVMLGAYSENALSGSAVCNQIQFFLLMLASGVSAGMIVIAAQYWGKKETEPIHKIFSVAFVLGLALSIVLTLIAAAAPEQLVRLFTTDDAIAVAAQEYLGVIKYTYILFMLTNIMTSVLRSVETVKIGFYVSLSSFLVNIFLNYALIYGRFGFPEMGIRGAAAATLASRILEMAVVTLYVFCIDKKLKLRLSSFFNLQKKYIKVFFKTGAPLMMSNISWGFAMSIQGVIIGRLGATAISANSIATTIFQVATVICYASGNVACVLIGKSIGERASLDVIKRRSKNLQLIFLAIGVGASATLLLCKTLILDYYDTSPETYRMTEIFIYILAVTIIGTSYEAPALCGIISGGGETSFVLKNDIVFMWCIVLPISVLSAFVFKFPVPITFACLKADQVLKCAVAYFKVNRFKWIRELT